MVANDVYRPHTGEEVAELVLPEVSARLVPGEKYGVWWFNKERVALTHGGKKRRKFTKKPKSEWIAVPVPDPGVRREWVDAARQVVEGFVRPSRAAGRVWELSGGVAYCACGRRMTTHSLTGDGGYHYYVCQRRKRDGKGACEHGRFHRAEALEAAVAAYVSDLLGDADRVAAHVDAAIAREANATRNPEGSAKAWLDKLAKCDRRRAAFQDQQAAGLMTLDELGDRLRGLDEEHAVAERELGRLRDTQRRIEELEANKEAVLRMFGTGLLVGIEWFPPRLRRAVYELLAARVTVASDRTLTIEANLDANPVRHTKDGEEYVEGLRGIEVRVTEAGALGTQEWIDLVERELFALRASLSDRTDTEEPEMVKMVEEVRSLPDEELDRTLAERLDLPYPVDAEVLDRALACVEEPERLSEGGPGGFTGAPDMSHEPRPEERRGEER